MDDLESPDSGIRFDAERVAEVASRLAEVDADFHRAVSEPTGREATRLRHLLKNARLGRRIDLRVVEPEDLHFAPGGDRAPRCAECADPCCADPLNEVALRLRDLWRFREAGLLDAVTADRPAKGDAAYERYAGLAEAEARDSFQRFPRLKKRADGSCVLFDRESGACSVYALRPLACRQFPHRPDSDASRLVRFNRRCRSSRPATGRELAQARREVVDNWNAKVRDLVTLEHGVRPLTATGLLPLLPDE